MAEEIPFRPEGYSKCYLALDALQLSNDITEEDYKLIRSMLDSEDEENLAMAELALADWYKGITIKYKKGS